MRLQWFGFRGEVEHDDGRIRAVRGRPELPFGFDSVVFNDQTGEARVSLAGIERALTDDEVRACRDWIVDAFE